jgi:radical SAM/Cys-rich protein
VNGFLRRLDERGLARPARRTPAALQVDFAGTRLQRTTVERILAVLAKSPSLATVEILGRAELNPNVQRLVNGSLALGRHVVLRCTPELLDQPGGRGLAEFLAVREVMLVVPLLPGALSAVAVRVLKRLNALGYGRAEGDANRAGLRLHLSYWPELLRLPGPQATLEAQVRAELRAQHGVVFDRLQAQVNMPVDLVAHEMERTGQLLAYRELLEAAFNAEAAGLTMCHDVLCVDADGRLYDCEFNRASGLPLGDPSAALAGTIFELHDVASLAGAPIHTGEHCFGCTAGQGSGCSGALVASTTPATAAPSTS